MKIGKFKYKLTILRNDPFYDEEGNLVENWQPLKKVWADITPITAREAIIAHAETGEITNKIYIRYTDVTPKDRLTSNGVTFVIDSVLPDRDHCFITIMARELF